MTKSFGIAAMIIVVAISSASSQTITNVEESFKKATEEIRPTLPKKVDQITTWTGVSHSGTSLKYDFKLDLKSAELPPNALSLIRQNTVKQVCQTSTVVNAMKAGGVYIYKYQTADAKSLGQFEVRSKDCAQ